MTGQESCKDCLFGKLCQLTVENADRQTELRGRLEAARAGYKDAADYADTARRNFSSVADAEPTSQPPSVRLTMALQALDRAIAEKSAWRETAAALEGSMLDHTDPALAANVQEAGDLGRVALESCDGQSCTAKVVLPKMVASLTK